MNGYSNWLEIDRQVIIGNIECINQWTGVPMMAVVKANGYGHGITEVVRTAVEAGVRYCGVARVEEAFELRRAGIDVPVLVLGFTPDERFGEAFAQNISLTFFQPQQLDVLAAAAREASRPAKIHLKVDTGMSRLGAAPELAYDMLQRLSGLENVEVEGIFTHFARADERYAPTTEWQLRRFTDLLAEIESAGLRPSIAHAANSAAALTRPGANFDMVRVGIALYGLAPSAEVELLEGMHPALSWHARLSHINVYPQGSGISYGHLYTTQGNERIGVVPVGYGDGYRREQGNIVLVHGRRVPVVGRVCMDQLMVRLDEVPEAEIGDEVVLIGEQGSERITAEELASHWNTFNYEVVCGLSARVPRHYI
ncbi:MAG: alanine racemase [Anaerolineales bacterium]